jgi:hypothetical protein
MDPDKLSEVFFGNYLQLIFPSSNFFVNMCFLLFVQFIAIVATFKL